MRERKINREGQREEEQRGRGRVVWSLLKLSDNTYTHLHTHISLFLVHTLSNTSHILCLTWLYTNTHTAQQTSDRLHSSKYFTLKVIVWFVAYTFCLFFFPHPLTYSLIVISASLHFLRSLLNFKTSVFDCVAHDDVKRSQKLDLNTALLRLCSCCYDDITFGDHEHFQELWLFMC